MYKHSNFVWLILTKTELDHNIAKPLELYYDNDGAIAQVKKPRSHKRSNKIFRWSHLIQEFGQCGDIHIVSVNIENNLVDSLTKLVS